MNLKFGFGYTITDVRVRFALKLSTMDGIQSRFIATFDNNAIDLMNSNEHFKQGFVIDMTCDGIESIFVQVRDGILRSECSWDDIEAK